MSSYPLVKFVDAPAVGATVRLDLNDRAAAAPRGVEADIDFGVPTVDGDPDAVGQQWGFRSPRFTVQLKGTKANALAFVSALSKELNRRTNWLLFQLDATRSPVWLRTYRTGYQPLSLEQVYGNSATGGNAPAGYPDVWRVEVPLVADAFFYGAKVAMSTFQVIQGPTDLTSPTRTAMRIVLPAIKGDAPTPLRVAITPANAADTSGNAVPAPSWLIGCISGKSTMSDPILDIGLSDGLTAGTGMGSGTSDANYFGGSYRDLSLASGALQTRLEGNLPTVPTGRYKVQLRCSVGISNVADGSYLFRLRVAPTSTAMGFNPVIGQSVPLSVPLGTTGNQTRGWIDLGEFTLPADITVPSASPDALPSTSSTTYFKLEVGTPTGAAGATGMSIDAIKLIPVDGTTVDSATMLNSSFTRGNPPQTSGSVLIGTWDGFTESYWGTISGSLVPSRPVLAGGFPYADPGAQQNLLIVMATNHGRPFGAANASVTSLNAQCAVDVSYIPRFLHIGDGT